MPTTQIIINGHSYEVACDAGQEERLQDLAASIDERMQELGRVAPSASDKLLLVMTSLILADELDDKRREAHQLRGQLIDASQSFEQGKIRDMEAAIAETMEEVAGRVDQIAVSLERAL